ncbi:Leucine-rich repeat, ribonuclease inhibitor subtype [Artemisia annua]|uniref:Leucine-rich repeat, ribonuclease inhibitor subtype n=1 Tax=Artemisia annua TaxID=35608 RepID=A0A2U1PM26_ARTAN|nr:Leucine-rich repeat, ribonuclease inhibitor subtype [Artemisia annua]
MSQAPSLVSLCINAVKNAILEENGNISYVYVLPAELFDRLVPELPPLALQNLQDAMPIVSTGDCVSSDDCLPPSRKRKRNDNFDIAWKVLYELRWGALRNSSVDTNWQQLYWEKHLQNCLDATWETVSVTLFDGFLGEVDLPDTLLKYISYEGHPNRSRNYSKLFYHCERFGQYARSLRLQSVHYVAELNRLLGKCQLESLEMHWIKSKEQVEGLSKFLEQNKETLSSIEFVNCKLPANLVTTICESLHVKGFETDVIKNFTYKRSSFLDSSCFPMPLGLDSLLTAARNLTTLVLSDNHIWWKTAKLLFDTLLEADSSIQVLDLSENNVAGWLSHLKWGSISGLNSDQQNKKSLKSLRVLNLRGNRLLKDDADCLKYAIGYMPKLEVLNLSDNHLQDDGTRNLFPFLIEKSQCETPLTELYLDKCLIACRGASQLLKVLAACKVPLKSLSIGDNFLSSQIDPFISKLVEIVTSSLDDSASDKLFPQQFWEVSWNILEFSSNKGGDRIARFLTKLISQSPKLVSIDASANWIPVESFPTVCSFLEAAKVKLTCAIGLGKLEQFNLMQNPLCNKPDLASLLAEFQINGKPNILLTTPPAATIPSIEIIYDNDP